MDPNYPHYQTYQQNLPQQHHGYQQPPPPPQPYQPPQQQPYQPPQQQPYQQPQQPQQPYQTPQQQQQQQQQQPYQPPQQQPYQPPQQQSYQHPQQAPYHHSHQQPYQHPHQQPRQMRLDPHAMPSVVQLFNDEIGSFKQAQQLRITAPASVPPLVATLESQQLDISLHDDGCVRPCHMRSTIYQVPISKDILDSSGLEFAVVVKPFDDAEVEGKFYVPVSPNEIIRCNRCKAYINPFSKNGVCCICNFASPRTQEIDQRPELSLGSYEFRVTPEYYRENIAECRRPHIIFAIETTFHSKYLLQHLSKNLAEVIRSHCPKDFGYASTPTPLIGFITFNSKITLHNVREGCQDYVIADASSILTPISKFLVDPAENFEDIERFLASLGESDKFDHEQQTVLGPVIDVALRSCAKDTSNYFANNKKAPNPKVIPAGKVYVFISSLPTAGDVDTPGRLSNIKNFDEMKKALGSDQESKVLGPEGKYYTQLAQRCVNDYASGVELFLAPPSPRVYLNVATLSELTRLTGTGNINKYLPNAYDDLLHDLKVSLKSTMAFDASMRVRTSTGISPVKYYGNFNNVSGPNLEMAAVNTNSNYIVQMKYDDKLSENDMVVVQFAMIYTSVCGERRVRVHNLALATCNNLTELYKSSCCDTLVNYLVRETVDKLRFSSFSSKSAKEHLTTRVINILSAYRKLCADNQGNNSSQLILPEQLKLLPVYLCGALKCDAIDGGPEMFPDDKILAQLKLLGAIPSMSQVTVYPRMYAINEVNEGSDAASPGSELGYTATLTRCFYLAIEEEKGQCYIVENGHYLFIFFPSTEAGQKFLSGVYGTNRDAPEISWFMRQVDTNESKYLEKLIDRIKLERRRALKIHVLRQAKDKLESIFKTFLYEDKKRPEATQVPVWMNASYVDLLCYLHAEIRAKIQQ